MNLEAQQLLPSKSSKSALASEANASKAQLGRLSDDHFAEVMQKLRHDGVQ